MKTIVEFALLAALLSPFVNAQASEEQWYVYIGASPAISYQFTGGNVAFFPFAPLISLSVQTHCEERSANPRYRQCCTDLLQKWESGPIGVVLEPVFLIPTTTSRDWVPYIAPDSDFFKCSSGSADTHYLLGSRSDSQFHRETDSYPARADMIQQANSAKAMALGKVAIPV